MYPIDVPYLIRRGTLGSHALDPTLPYRQPRRLRTQRVLAAVRRATHTGRPAAAATHETASTASS